MGVSRPKDEDGDFQLDSDEPSDSATVGYLLNHLFLNVGNLSAGIAFYAKGFGMRDTFTTQVTNHYSLAYIAHSHGEGFLHQGHAAGQNHFGDATVAHNARELVEGSLLATYNHSHEPMSSSRKQQSHVQQRCFEKVARQ
ncbi:Glyoxalase/bleomycin resistance protein/dioxygenase [Metarhizium brunneum]